MGDTIRDLFAVGCGGFVGSVFRWELSVGMQAALPGVPAGTFLANVIAGLVIGLVTGAGTVVPIPTELKLLLTVGLCGGLSTFSTFSNETFQMIQRGQWGMALLNIGTNVVVCLLAVYVGTRLGATLVASRG